MLNQLLAKLRDIQSNAKVKYYTADSTLDGVGYRVEKWTVPMKVEGHIVDNVFVLESNPHPCNLTVELPSDDGVPVWFGFDDRMVQGIIKAINEAL